MKTHYLKTVQPHFDNIKNGWKNFELRLNDRNFLQNDIVILEEYNPLTDEKTGQKIRATIGTVLENFPGLNFQYCIFSLLDPIQICGCKQSTKFIYLGTLKYCVSCSNRVI